MATDQKTKKIRNMIYGLGGAVVILGALFKILHWELGPLNGSVLLAVGLITEAGIFSFSAFEKPEEELDWSLAYPELSGGPAGKRQIGTEGNADGMLSQKLDTLLKEAKLDVQLMERLGNSIKEFEGAAKGIAPTSDAIKSAEKYAQELNDAAVQMGIMNGLYKGQIESSKKQSDMQAVIAQDAAALKAQMEAFSKNIVALNEVYGGMLSAMNRK
jgi:gliding motility-associated protein GldL|tara:strand:- start:1316 stop:1960 length:645 start_codon:yes stop_codon:yes gene_type:complete